MCTDIDHPDKDNTAESHKYCLHKADFDGVRQDSLSKIDMERFLCFNPNASSVWSAFVNIVWDQLMTVPYTGVVQLKNTVTKRKRHPHHIRRLMTKNGICGKSCAVE